MRLTWWRSGAVILLVVAVEELLRWTILPFTISWLEAVLSAAVTTLVAAAVAWLWRRWRRAREQELAGVQAGLQRAVHELSRTERLAAAGAMAVPLCADLTELVAQLQARGEDHELIDHVAGLLDRFTVLAKASRRAMRPVDLAGLVGAQVAEVGAAQSVQFGLVRPPSAVWVRANPDRLALATRHFLTHAAETSGEGRVMVVLHVTDTSAAVVIATDRAGSGGEPASLSWGIARAALAECAGEVTALEEGEGLVLRLKLPVCRAPRRRRQRPRPNRQLPASAICSPAP